MTPVDFMRRHWQKRPLCVPRALTDDAGLIDQDGLFALAQREDVPSRLVMRSGRRWTVRHGPFRRAELKRLPARGWSLLVQGVDQVDARAARLLRRFSFLPYARLDDVMVSYAPPGGGVGPHFDSYDVFLLQGAGRRRWQVSAQRDLALVPDAPLRILERFRPTREWIVETGDLLYLPPRYAHDGDALAGCITISVGFRAPSAAELAARFLDHLQDTLAPSGHYRDPDLAPVTHPAALDGTLIDRYAGLLGAIRWTRADVADFAGRYLTEPKPHVRFERPRRPLTLTAFADQLARRGLRLALASALLYRSTVFFMNGEQQRVAAATARVLRRLADTRSLPPMQLTGEGLDLLHAWYDAGYVVPGAP